MTASSYPNQKPGLFTAISVMTLISGIVNLIWGFVASLTALSTFFGVICVPITILPTVLGIFEVIYAAKLLSAQPQPIKPNQTLAAFEIASFIYGNIFSMVVGILVLVFYNDLVVKEYLAQLNGTAGPAFPEAQAAPAEAELPESEEAPDK